MTFDSLSLASEQKVQNTVDSSSRNDVTQSAFEAPAEEMLSPIYPEQKSEHKTDKENPDSNVNMSKGKRRKS